MSDYVVKDDSLTAVADAIRAKSGSNEQLEFPDGFVRGISNIASSGVTSINGLTGDVTGIQTTANLVTSVSSQSTDEQYPSAKCLNDELAQKENATVIVRKTSSDTSQTLAENTFYIWPEILSLTITCPSTGGPYAFRFTSGSTVTTFSMSGIVMPSDWEVKTNTIYEVNILEGYAVATSWEVGS